jgi:hypothetical protein
MLRGELADDVLLLMAFGLLTREKVTVVDFTDGNREFRVLHKSGLDETVDVGDGVLVAAVGVVIVWTGHQHNFGGGCFEA